MVYTVTLNPALDYVLKVARLRDDDINRTESEALYYGGKGINVSVILTRLGIPNKALGFVGGFTGKQLEAMLKADGIDCDFCYLDSGMTRINVKVKMDKELDINAQGPTVSTENIEELLKKLDGMQNGDYLVLAGAIPPSLPSDVYERMMRYLTDKEVCFVVDATGDLLLKALPYKPFLVKPNHLELGDLFGVKLQTAAEIEHFARKLQKMGARNVLVSRAENGALLLDEYGSVYEAKNADGILINSVGCGDSMVAGFLAGYIEKRDYAYALKLGTACGNATAYSDTLATRQEIDNILNQSIIKSADG